MNWFRRWLHRPTEPIDIADLLAAVPALRWPGARVGLPDDPTPVAVADPDRLVAALHDILQTHDCPLVSAEVNPYHRAVWVRFVDLTGTPMRVGRTARRAVSRCGGEMHHWPGDNYFNLSFPFGGPMREAFPEVGHLPWDDRYRALLDRAAWDELRGRVFRFADHAEEFAGRCVEAGLGRVLVPSVGLCVHPWQLADHGLTVVATDRAESALDTLARPDLWPRLYTRAAAERWDIAQAANYATQGNPDRFDRMPDLADTGIRDALRRRIAFAAADWTELPLADGGVDALFATNALPRESADDLSRVLAEWVRVVRPGGLAFIAMHNFGPDIEPTLSAAGWVAVDVLRGERAATGVTGFQVRYSSG